MNRRRRSTSTKSKPDRSPIDRMGSTTLFSRAQKVFREGQFAGYLYKVQLGCIRTYTNINGGSGSGRFVSGFYFPGDYFGLEMLEKHRISAEAVVPSTVLVIKKQALNARTAADIAVAKQLRDCPAQC